MENRKTRKLAAIAYAVEEISSRRTTAICGALQNGLERQGFNVVINYANGYYFPTFYSYKPKNPVGAWWFPKTEESRLLRLGILESLRKDVLEDRTITYKEKHPQT